MRKIDKRAEPREWKDYRKTPGARYQSFDFLVDALLDEQGYICAYCERRIPHQDVQRGEDHPMNISTLPDLWFELRYDINFAWARFTGS